MTHYLIAISIGPVQEFIAAARKTADLYAGSDLLLKIVLAAARTFPPNSLIFPADKDSQGANKILAQIDGDPVKQVRRAKAAAKGELDNFWSKALAQLSDDQQAWIDTKRAKEQRENFVEFYAAWVKLDESGDNYAKARKRVEQLLSGRKALRNFNKFDQNDDGVPKSPLDPAFASVIIKQDKAQADSLSKPPLSLNPSETLDAISLIKRIAGNRALTAPSKDMVVPSTHVIAARAKDPDAKLDEDVKPPYAYYAILVADGDNMGKLLSNNESKKQHQDISRALDKFAIKAGEIVKADNGFLVYAGGDDVLALLPVTTALKCGQELAKEFAEHLEPFATNEIKATLSAGIAIVHYLEPLSTSLKQARAAEKSAKNVEGKGAVCLALHTRGGAPLLISSKWDTAQKVQEYQEKEFPRGLPYELRELAREWPTDIETEDDKSKLNILDAEVKRIVRRKRDRDGAESEKLKEFTQFLTKVTSIKDLQLLADQLVLARFLSGKGDLA